MQGMPHTNEGTPTLKPKAQKSKALQPEHFLEACPSWTSPSGSWSVRGMSRGSMRTGFVGDGILRDVFFDAAVNSYRSPKAILLTHTHTDHSSAIADVSTGVAAPFDVFLPAGAVDPLKMFLVGSAAIADCTTEPKLRPDDGIPTRFALRLVGLRDGDERPLVAGNSGLHVRVRELRHTAPSMAFFISQARETLRSDLRGLPGAEIARRRAAGEHVMTSVTVPVMAFFGDSDAAGISRALELESAMMPPAVFVECTWLDVPIDEVDEGRHSGWATLGPIINLYGLRYPSTCWMLMHFSRRYSDEQVCEFFAALPDPPENVWLWLCSGPVSVASLKMKE